MSEPRDAAVVLVSGGMDSCVTAAIACSSHDPAFLHVRYGQRTESKEAECFAALADAFGASRRLVVRLDHLKAIGGSSLTDPSMAIPEGAPDRKTIPPTYVPFRNGQMIAVATAWAEVIGARAIYIGAVEEDSSGYPDCRREFFDACETMIAAGTKPGAAVKILTPVIQMRKGDIVRKGLELSAPLHLTWSCYRSEDLACGTCDSCLLRLRGFSEAGTDDPIPYLARPGRPGE